MLQRIKAFSAVGAEVDELIELSAMARMYRAEYDLVGAEAPEWLDTAQRAILKEIKSRLGESLENRLREAKARRTALLTVDEKRNALDREIEALESKLKQ